jgi:hypothetical protein
LGETVSGTDEFSVQFADRKPLHVRVAEAMTRRIRRGHYVGPRDARFWAHVAKGVGCWVWSGAMRSNGYGVFKIDGRAFQAHAITYMLARGEIPAGNELDHLCRNTRCVNPDHLEAVPHRENVLRGSSPSAIQARRALCRRGHPFSRVNGRGRRVCQTCENAGQRERYRLKMASLAEAGRLER